MKRSLLVALILLALATFSSRTSLAEDFIPRRQKMPPGPPVSAEEAIKRMVVPAGFTVEVVAAEPDIVNPVAMTFDEQGRIWVTESFEYPRLSAGPGRDRVKVLEDTDHDGKVDKVTIFAEGLNIPSGIAVGHGGVWVANSPDILFLQDTDGDLKADKQEVIVTGFGRTDTHELPNSLTWGPDGFLYGLNGVFNFSSVAHGGKKHDFTCAMFRIDPRKRTFELFCEGTSNPWGIAFNHQGEAFISACVIDHLWHLTETGYYHRQGGPYPPHTWKLESIVKHKHQEAAYCGIHYFDSDAYPAEYRDKLYMGNIHGGCINTDSVAPKGSTYFGTGHPDFLTANDPWFMPVVQKTGPDGSLYVLDWYDRYHCYQDANRDPAGIDRLKGRLYRIRYEGTPRAGAMNFAKLSTPDLIAQLEAGNDMLRSTAVRILAERRDPAAVEPLEAMVLSDRGQKFRLQALFALISSGPLRSEFHAKLLSSDEPVLRSWGVRAAGNQGEIDAALVARVKELAVDADPTVKLQVAIAAKKIKGLEPQATLLTVLSESGDDPQLAQIVWQNLHPLLETESEHFVALLSTIPVSKSPAWPQMLPRSIDRILSSRSASPTAVAAIFALVASGPQQNLDAASACLAILSERVQSRELSGEALAALKTRIDAPIEGILAGDKANRLYTGATLLAATLGNEKALAAAREILKDAGQTDAHRLQAIAAITSSGNSSVLVDALAVVTSEKGSLNLRSGVLASLGRLEDPAVAAQLVAVYAKLDPELRPRTIELLTQRLSWSKLLLAEISAGKISPSSLNASQVRKLLAIGDMSIAAEVAKHWGSVRADRDPDREKVIAEMRTLLRSGKGNPVEGQAVFSRVCGQCHKLHGAGQEVGPDITSNGRGSFEQLLSNVFDPSLVIGASYQARVVLTADGRVLTGLLVEDNEQRIVLKMQGGKLETIARDDIDDVKVSPLSLMPEKLETTIKPQEMLDLFALLTLDRPPSDPEARLIPGTVAIQDREEPSPAKWNELTTQIVPGWNVVRSGEGGVALIGDHFGRSALRLHPTDRNAGAILSRKVTIAPDKKTRLLLNVSYDPRGDWHLRVKASEKLLHEGPVSEKTASGGWQELSIDLTPFAGKTIDLQVLNDPSGWAYEFGFIGRAEIVVE
ncbi:membrane-bound dehydrogenase domain protein [Pirellula staleyi DSM 6068]|uniref:Membrane-bound dehydrogenase domain protein n=1 Tax=Pirellula staleyi (strain ATCC 27377 / DSM 6068 / ICPB 4128) TaxID=530564 RepID=D2R0S0_PIRSD|nr:PVC-type heme-binding CxxCH protein [Pirellula staleyi]ADB16668.1 membrane-bound dehydrogenase domain protein [Pirellula staleyi DSM 6068]